MVSSKQRRIDELRRREGFKETRKSILIVCEGSMTEPIYFTSLKNKLRLKMVEVDVVGEGAAPINVVDRAVELRAERKRDASRSLTKVAYDIVYCVVDVEAPQPHESLARAVNKARDNGVEVILSNPCFEFWYILHFRKTSAPFNTNRNVVSQLRQDYPAYNKSDGTIFGVIYPKTHDAIRHSAQVLREQHNDAEDLRDCNPSTDVHRIVGPLRDMAEQ
jgi:hypothetical protein